MSPKQNVQLFSLIGTYFGGNGTTEFQLPNLQGSIACCMGQGGGLDTRTIGQSFGTPTAPLSLRQIPSHNHSFTATVPAETQVSNAPSSTSYLGRTLKQDDFSNAAADGTFLSSNMVGLAGTNQAHENRQPYLAMTFCIALQGVYPARP